MERLADKWTLIALSTLAVSLVLFRFAKKPKKPTHLAVLKQPNLENHVRSVKELKFSIVHYSDLVKLPPPINFNYLKLINSSSKAVYKYASNLLYSYSTTSTQTLLESYFPDTLQGVLYVSEVQTQGRGRTGDWESPEGCLMFSYKFTCEVKYAVILQCLIPLAILKSIQKSALEVGCSLEQLSDLKVKWPNDVYLGNEKIAGILVNSTSSGKYLIACIGVGINVENETPTVSLRNKLSQKISRERVLINYLESFEELFNSALENQKIVFEDYKNNWKDYNKGVLLKPNKTQGTLIDLNTDGQLVVVDAQGEKHLISDRESIEFLN